MAMYSLHIDLCYRCLLSNFQKCWTGLDHNSVSYQGLVKEHVMKLLSCHKDHYFFNLKICLCRNHLKVERSCEAINTDHILIKFFSVVAQGCTDIKILIF